MQYFPLDSGKGVIINALVDSGAYVSVITQTQLEENKQRDSNNIFKIGDPPIFEIQVASSQSENRSEQPRPNLIFETMPLEDTSS